MFGVGVDFVGELERSAGVLLLFGWTPASSVAEAEVGGDHLPDGGVRGRLVQTELCSVDYLDRGDVHGDYHVSAADGGLGG